jgi:hypothetical protein
MIQATPDPFFIVGCGRSGTTLLRTLLNAHPQIGIPQESLFIVDYLKSSPSVDMSRLKALLVREPELSEWGIHPEVGQLDGCETAAQAIDRLHQIYLALHGKRRWGQKTPRLVRSIDLLLDHFPGSRFVHLVRDPRAVVNSLITSNVHRSNAYFGAKRWQRDVSLGLASEKSWPERVLRVRYEDLVTDTELTLQQISRFLGLAYDPAMISEAAEGAGEYSRFYEAIHANLNLPPTDRFISRWMERLTTDQIKIVEGMCGSLMTEIGYEPSLRPLPAMPDRTASIEIDRGWGLLRQTVQYLRFRRRYLFYVIYRKWKLGLLRDFSLAVNY